MDTTLGICFLHIFPQRPERERENHKQRTVSFTRDLAVVAMDKISCVAVAQFLHCQELRI